MDLRCLQMSSLPHQSPHWLPGSGPSRKHDAMLSLHTLNVQPFSVESLSMTTGLVEWTISSCLCCFDSPVAEAPLTSFIGETGI